MQQLSGQIKAIPGDPWGTNLTAGGGSGGSAYTRGYQTIFLLQAQPTIARPWTIYSWAMHGKGFTWPNGGGPCYGLMGRILGSLIVGGSVTPAQGFFTPAPKEALPNLATIWDPATDQPFPQAVASPSQPPTATGYFQSQNQLPQPLPLAEGDQLAIGVWLTPSPLANTNVNIYGMEWSVNYTVGAA